MKTVEETQFRSVWRDMMNRCINPNHKSFKNYGGRGITVSDEWQTFATFYADMWPRPAGMTVERKDNDLGYSKDNCRWADRQAQALNKRIYSNSPCGIAGIDYGWVSGSYRVRLRYKGETVISKTVHDFFEACCLRKSAELKWHMER